MELINFRLSGRFAHFLRAEASASALSYPVPPRTVILGIMGAVLGLPKDEPQVALEPANIAISGKLPKTHWHRAKFRKDPPAPLPCIVKKTQKLDRNTTPEKANLILQEWLFNPVYTIWVSIPEPYHIQLESRLKERRWHFTPFLGLEAGVDIDMDFVIRDFAPLDSLIQVAGRCNREGRMPQLGIVEIVDLSNQQDKRYSEMIYDDVHLNVTRRVLERIRTIEEKEILPLANQYFEMLSIKKDTGIKHLEKFVRWQEGESIRELLRGKERKKYTFLVLKQDVGLKDEMKKANEIEDRWNRREAWRAIAGRIAKISIDVYARPRFDPQHIATECLGQWILQDRFYSPERGLVLDDDSDEGVLIL